MANCPKRGDMVWLNLSPSTGHEQARRRPALVISASAYNERVGLSVCCPVTSRQKGYPFEVGLGTDAPVQGAVLADQVRSLDWRAREAEPIGRVSPAVLHDVIQKIKILLDS
ncbi:endoribonuclease MazF [Alicyclobacillus acidocaldarius]|uniref:endoribonuclease MazF n=1 Tax=Alicyclobacillus acidocaldarius TaxID=405212 RepID=UPI00345ED553